jgi:serine/threonine protein kinase
MSMFFVQLFWYMVGWNFLGFFQNVFPYELSPFNYSVIFKMGEGSFGKIYQVKDPTTGKIYVCKTERNTSRSLAREQLAYSLLNGTGIARKSANSHLVCKLSEPISSADGFASIYWYGMLDVEHRGIVIDMLGKNMRTLMSENGNKFSLRTTALLAIQMISLLELLHNITHFSHRDIKPENFVLGLGEKAHRLHLIDFGESKPFMRLINGSLTHIPYRVTDGYVGTRKFMSMNAHLGVGRSLFVT